MASLGKRYGCEECGSMVLCTVAVAGAVTGEVQCCSTPMVEQQAKSLPASD